MSLTALGYEADLASIYLIAATHCDLVEGVARRYADAASGLGMQPINLHG